LTCWSTGFESSVKATVGRLKNIQIYIAFCIYTTTTLQVRFHHHNERAVILSKA
jgi:hypothetical protein